ncbi:MAG: SDR family oxidoreductase [Nitriliruptorales bacterium]|nr:SDR family oxidoreductase [Nitriliruptorales bacterium]
MGAEGAGECRHCGPHRHRRVRGSLRRRGCLARVAATVPQGRMGTPDDVAAAVWFLSSEDAAFVTGASLELHGGNEWPAFLRAAKGKE